MADPDDLPPPLPLLIAHARKTDREWHALCWRIDDRMARIVLGKKEGAIAAIRLAWWEEALTTETPNIKGEPTLERWHAIGPGDQARQWVKAVAGAWRLLLDPDPMREEDWRAFGEGRGALFPLIARGGDAEALARAGALWALWDMARRDTDRQRAEGAFAALVGEAATTPALSRIGCRPIAFAAAMAMDDAREGIMPEDRFTPRQYLRMLRRALFG